VNSITGLVPWLQPYCRWLLAQFPGAVLTSTRRTHAEQTRLYRRYLAGQHPYPVAPPGRSAHESGLAFDAWHPTQLDEMGALWQRMGGRWGGERDRVHFGV